MLPTNQSFKESYFSKCNSNELTLNPVPFKLMKSKIDFVTSNKLKKEGKEIKKTGTKLTVPTARYKVLNHIDHLGTKHYVTLRLDRAIDFDGYRVQFDRYDFDDIKTAYMTVLELLVVEFEYGLHEVRDVCSINSYEVHDCDFAEHHTYEEHQHIYHPQDCHTCEFKILDGERLEGVLLVRVLKDLGVMPSPDCNI